MSGRYRVVEELGKGGMGTVYKAVYEPADKEYDHSDRFVPEPGSIVVVKSAKKTDTAAESLRRERTLLTIFNRNNTPGVPRGYGDFEFNGNYYVVMEFIDGKPMSHYIENANDEGKWISEKMVAKWGTDIANTLVSFSHLSYDGGLSIIHDDLKPANIIIDENGNAIIADFGCARKWNDNILDTDSRVGTSGFFAPERKHRLKGSDLRSDTYSFGATIYAALTGETSNYPTSPALGMRSKRSASDIITRVVHGCMQIEPERRMKPETARDMLRELTKHPYLRSAISVGKTYSHTTQPSQAYDIRNGVLGKM
ncbi:MAG: serine/threonine protein kinase [Candidatus Aenigmarchaeota archaeon]|nr:serine/threonine protein kinase [Candidatus Aenigmarchaeota archaeon]